MLKIPGNISRVFDGVRRFKEEFDPDFVKIMTDGYFYLPLSLDAKTPEELSRIWMEKRYG